MESPLCYPPKKGGGGPESCLTAVFKVNYTGDGEHNCLERSTYSGLPD